MSTMSLLLSMAGFLAVLLLLEGTYTLWNARRAP